jgi:hypothetical protein
VLDGGFNVRTIGPFHVSIFFCRGKKELISCLSLCHFEIARLSYLGKLKQAKMHYTSRVI